MWSYLKFMVHLWAQVIARVLVHFRWWPS
jgi:hypothetical protein